MRRASSLGALARLELLHARGELRWALFAFGIDSEHDRGFLERTYQAYMALVVLVALGLMWSGVLLQSPPVRPRSAKALRTASPGHWERLFPLRPCSSTRRGT